MTKTKLEVIGMSHPYFIKIIVSILTTLESIQRMKVKLHKVESLSLSSISGILIAFFSVAGCSDMPYTGSMMATDDMVDQYIVSPNEELVCLQNGTDSACLTLIPKESKKTDSINGPIIHIHPEKLVYMFYHEGKEIVRAEKIMDTTEIVETLTETKEHPSPQTGVPSGGIVAHDADGAPQPPPPPPQPQDPPTDDTQQPPPPPPQPRAQSGGNVGDDPNDNNNPDDTPPPPQDPPSDSTPPPPSLRTDDPPSDNTPPPPPSPANNQLVTGNSGNMEPDPPRHPTPDAMYYGGEWSVSVYYPENYMGTPTVDNPGFTITSGSRKITIQKIDKISCGFVPNWPCNSLIDPASPRTYIARVVIEATDSAISVNVVWDPDSGNWDGDPPSPTYMTCACDPPTGRIISASVE